MAERSRRSREEWAQIIAGWQASGLSRRGYCEREGLSQWAFRYWQGKLAEQEESGAGLVKVEAVVAVERPAVGMRVRCRGIEVELSGQESEELLGRVFRALRGE